MEKLASMISVPQRSQHSRVPEASAARSTLRPSPLDRSVVEYIFEKMVKAYGSQFADKWGAIDPVELKEDWAEALAGFTQVEIERGIASLSKCGFPPSRPEFVQLCRPPLDYQAALDEALMQMRRRHDDGSDTWSNPAIYWAAAKISYFDLRNTPWAVLKPRWIAALDEAMANPRGPVPPKAIALPAPGETRVSGEKMRETFAAMDAKRGRAPREPVNPDQAEQDRHVLLAAERELQERIMKAQPA